MNRIVHDVTTLVMLTNGILMYALCFVSAQTHQGAGCTFRRKKLQIVNHASSKAIGLAPNDKWPARQTAGQAHAKSHIDHVLMSHQGAHAVALATTLSHEDSLVTQCRTDHCPVILNMLTIATAPPVHEQRTTVFKPRLERLREEVPAKAYATHCTDDITAWRQMLQHTAHCSPQYRLDTASVFLTNTANAAVGGSLGFRQHVSGRNITVRCRRQSTVHLIRKRRRARALHKRRPTPENEARAQRPGEQVDRARAEDWRIFCRRRIDNINSRFRTRTQAQEMHNYDGVALA